MRTSNLPINSASTWAYREFPNGVVMNEGWGGDDSTLPDVALSRGDRVCTPCQESAIFGREKGAKVDDISSVTQQLV